MRSSLTCFPVFHLLFSTGRQFITVLHFAAALIISAASADRSRPDHIEGAVTGYITGETQDGFVDIIVRHDYIKSFWSEVLISPALK